MSRLSPTGRATTADGLGIAWYDLGGSGPVLLLAHATGFCGAVLGPLAHALGHRYRCIAFDERGHGSSDRPPRGDFGWHGFAADVLAVVDHLEFDGAAGFGHSCGAAALLLAEEARPGTFSALYGYEPILYPGDPPLPPTVEGNPLSAGAGRRRPVFGSRAEALENFATKAPLNVLDNEVLVAYVDNGFEPDGQGIRLCCHREDEAQIYAHGMAHDAFGRLDRVRCPVTLACGETTDAMGPDVLDLVAARLARARVEIVAGLGHFGPMEDPGAVARSVAGALGQTAGMPGTGTTTA